MTAPRDHTGAWMQVPPPPVEALGFASPLDCIMSVFSDAYLKTGISDKARQLLADGIVLTKALQAELGEDVDKFVGG